MSAENGMTHCTVGATVRGSSCSLSSEGKEHPTLPSIPHRQQQELTTKENDPITFSCCKLGAGAVTGTTMPK
jgi:hypothetical protein